MNCNFTSKLNMDLIREKYSIFKLNLFDEKKSNSEHNAELLDIEHLSKLEAIFVDRHGLKTKF